MIFKEKYILATQQKSKSYMKPSSDIESTGCSITGGNPVRYSARFFVIFGLQYHS